MEKNRQSQNNKVLNHMIEKGPISFMIAFEVYGITRLSARIQDLEESGIPIIAVSKQFWSDGVFRFNYKEYSLERSYLHDIRGY